jgi:subtilisin-like proprotein convertase family protein
MATPHVAGAWAVLREVNNTATVDSVLTALQDTGVSITDTRSGAGSRVTSRIQLDDALNALATPSAPAAPGNLQAYSVSETEIIVTWDDNSFNEDNFRLERSTGGGSWSVVDSNIAAETTSYTDSGLTCGTEYEYRVRAENSVGDSSWSNTDSATPSQIETNTYTYGGADVPIPDNGTITVDLNVPDTGTLSDIDVHFDAAHSWVEDLDVYLESPAGTRVLLVADEGGNGDNFSGTIFDDEATQTIVGASAPFTGRFQPEGSLADFGGESINGTWKLEVTDDEAGIVGTITNFELDIATLSGTCPSVNSAPVLTPGDVQDLDAIDEDEENATNSGTLVSDVLGTAVTDADGDPEGIAVTDVDNTDGTWQYATTGSNWTSFGSPSQSSARLLAADSNTRVRFVPDTNYHGTVSNGITFRAWDQSDSSSEGSTADASSGGGDSAFSSATASAGISVTSVNDEPEIGGSNPRSVTMDEDGDPTAFSLTLNATDIDGDTLTWSISDPADHGEAVASGMGTSKSISYTPDSNYNGSDSFDVRVTDGKGGQDTVTVNVTITQQNDAPEIDEGESVTVNMDENGDPTAFDLTLNASDIDGDTITWSISDPADHGSANVSGTGTQKSISYTPDTDYSGSDSFVVQVTDGSEQDTITVNVNINPAANNPPEITEGDSVTVNMDEDGDPTSFSLTLNATDIDGDPLDWRIDTVADHGTAIVSGTGSTKAVSYTVDADYNGSDSFVVQVEDGNGGADSITVDVDIDPVNDAPEFTKGSNISVPMNAGAQTRPGWATNIRPGPITATDEATQALSFTLEILNTTGSLSFDTDPALDAATGDLTFHATDATTGTATVRLWLSDDGDDIAPHVNTSTIKQFTIAVGMEGPTGSIDDVSVEMNAEDTVIDLFAAFDDTNDSDADLTYTVQDNTNPSLVGTSIDDTAGTLTLEYTADATGSATITVRVTDTDGNIIDAPFQVVVGSGYNLYIPLIVS